MSEILLFVNAYHLGMLTSERRTRPGAKREFLLRRGGHRATHRKEHCQQLRSFYGRGVSGYRASTRRRGSDDADREFLHDGVDGRLAFQRAEHRAYHRANHRDDHQAEHLSP